MKFLILILFFFAISNVKAGPGDGTGGIGGGLVPNDSRIAHMFDGGIFSPRVGVTNPGRFTNPVVVSPYEPEIDFVNRFGKVYEAPVIYPVYPVTGIYDATPAKDYMVINRDHILVSPLGIQSVQDIYGVTYKPQDLYGTKVDHGGMFRFEINDPRFIDVELVNDEVIDLSDDTETIMDLWRN